MQAQVVLIPNESKKLMAKAILQLEEFQNALEKGIVAMHQSSSTLFLFEEIMKRRPKGVWVCGTVAGKGLCISREALQQMSQQAPGPSDSLQSRWSWFFKNGVLQEDNTLGNILGQMTASDVYVKGCNALDPQGNVGVLYAKPAGGAIGKVISAYRKKNFHFLLPIGLEKLIPISIKEASKKAGFKRVDQAMGMPCGLMPVPGRKIDEIDAFKIISGAQATPIASGGLGGAEGSIVLALNGTKGQITTALEVVQAVKGAKLPRLNLLDCDSCQNSSCHLVRDRKG